MKTPIPDYLEEVLAELRGVDDGATADYIPELASAYPERSALAITSADGSTYSAGDAEVAFTIQSISKPFAYAAAIMDRGLDRVLKVVGVEPSGEAFDELSLEGETHRPKNPMINAGAITAHALLVGPTTTAADRVERIRSLCSRLAGRELAVDERVAASELETADRNLAIAHMLRTYGIVDDPAHELVEGYVRQCALLVTVEDLSMMGATLAAGGVQPRTGEQLMPPEVARQVMAVMAAAGMYDAAGDWLTRVGIPAKSGVAGGMVGVLPDRAGISAFSPRLDARGNSVRGRMAFERLSADMGMHLFAADRGLPDRVELDDDGTAATLVLRGTVEFTAAAQLLDLMATLRRDTVLLDVSRVHTVSDVGRRMTLEGLRRLRLDGVRVQLHDPGEVLPDPDLGDGSRPERR